MLLDVAIDKKSVSIDIPNPFRLDMGAIKDGVEGLAVTCGADVSGLDIQGLVPRMVKGIAGCEGGCPADAQRLVRNGVEGFSLQYVEGGILTAEAPLQNGSRLTLKMFPEF